MNCKYEYKLMCFAECSAKIFSKVVDLKSKAPLMIFIQEEGGYKVYQFGRNVRRGN